jgi:CDP-diacylglycerol--serine O-phosphatidyltransferase
MHANVPARRATDIPQKRVRRGMYILPSLFTCGNIAAGFYAILQTMRGSALDSSHYDYAAIAIGFAILFDGLDGRIARMTNTVSDFGRELDSLADVITFGVAPALLAYSWGFNQIAADANGQDMLMRVVHIGGIVSFLFLVSGASRLARFNISKNPQPKNPGRPGRKYFVGMPIPAGAAMIAATVHFGDGAPIDRWWEALLWLVFVVLISYLMVSTWRFWSPKGIDLRTRQPFWMFLLICGFVALLWYYSEYVLFALGLLYLVSGVIARFAYALRRRPPATPSLEPESRVDLA